MRSVAHPRMTRAAARLWLVEPWFSAPGHPAQTLRSTVEALSGASSMTCVVPRCEPSFEPTLTAIAAHAEVLRYRTPSQWLPAATAFSLPALRRRIGDHDAILFLDAHLVTLAALWGVFASKVAPARLAVLYLRGPERIAAHGMAMSTVRRFVDRPFVRLLLRTEELAEAWAAVLPPSARRNLGTLPTLEIPPVDERVEPRRDDSSRRFLVIGQLRTGKGLERLVPLFRSRPDLGTLTVAGAFASESMRSALQVLTGFPGLREGYLDEADLLATVAENDYVLMLYDGWDHRMEAATLFLAARVGRPVVAFDAGWTGRMVRTFGCGVPIPLEAGDLGSVVAGLPQSDSVVYQAMVDGMALFREAHLPDRLRERFLATLFD